MLQQCLSDQRFSKCCSRFDREICVLRYCGTKKLVSFVNLGFNSPKVRNVPTKCRGIDVSAFMISKIVTLASQQDGVVRILDREFS